MVSGYEGEKKSVYLKWASHFWLPIQNFILPKGEVFLILGGRAGGRVGGLAWWSPPRQGCP